MAQNDLSILRHSAAHLAAQAILELYPGTLLTIGPATEEGFFYDFLPPRNLKEEDLHAIEERMHELSKKNYPLKHREIPKDEARALFKNNPFKLEMIDEIPSDMVGLSEQGDFKDLCRGGHFASTGDIKYFKLLGISGSYWRADKSKQALQRIHGTAFFTAEELSAFEKHQEDLLQYDHRRLGKQLDYFSLHDDAAGFPFFHPKGQQIIMTLMAYMRQLHKEYDYKEIATPTVLNADLWRRSGHYHHYKRKYVFLGD